MRYADAAAALIGVAAASLPGLGAAESGRVVAEGAQALEAGIALAIRAERFDDAQRLIEALPPEVRETPRFRFVEAQVARRRGEPRRAIDLYQRLLSQDDDLLRVRLELAATYVEIGADGAAEQNYRLALAGDPEPQVRAFISAKLAEINDRRRWRVSVSLAVAPDTNVNGATDAERVQILGLPFELSEEAKKTGGVNVTAALGVDRIVRFAPGKRLRASAFGRITDNEGADFDDATLGVRLGPEWRLGKLNVAARATGEQRWFGGDPFALLGGVRLEADRSVSRRTHLSGAVSAVHQDERQHDVRDGWIYGLDLTPTFYQTPRRFFRLSASARRAETQLETESYWLGRLGVGVYQTLPQGLAIYVEPSASRREHDEPVAAFGETRRDTELSLSGRLTKRDWTLLGLTPFVGAQLIDNDSTIEIEDFRRERFELGVTRSF